MNNFARIMKQVVLPAFGGVAVCLSANVNVAAAFDTCAPDSLISSTVDANGVSPQCSYITLTPVAGCGFGDSRDTVNPDHPEDPKYRIERRVWLAASGGTMYALDYLEWQDDSIIFAVNTYTYPTTRPTLQESVLSSFSTTQNPWPGTWAIGIDYIEYYDSNDSGSFDDPDEYSAFTSRPGYSGISIDLDYVYVGPTILSVEPNAVSFEEANSANPPEATITGTCFDDFSTNKKVRIGSKAQFEDTVPSAGKNQPNVNLWTATEVKVLVDNPGANWGGKSRKIWLEDSYKKTDNFEKITFTLP